MVTCPQFFSLTAQRCCYHSVFLGNNYRELPICRVIKSGKKMLNISLKKFEINEIHNHSGKSKSSRWCHTRFFY